MVSDGYGPASATLARSYVQYLYQSGHPSIGSNGRWSYTSTGFEGKLGVGKGGFGSLPLDRLMIGQTRVSGLHLLMTCECRYIADSFVGFTGHR